MPKVLIVADDLTGANDTGVMIAQQGLKTYTILNRRQADKEALRDCGCISISTDSRGIRPQEAYQRVSEAAVQFGGPEVELYSKRIDTTLRGNMGAETDAMLDTLGNGYIAVVVPCFPEAGRIYIGGYLLVNGVPLYRTAVANDPKNPIRTSSASQLFAIQSKYPVASVHMEDLARGEEYVAQKMQEYQAGGVRSIIFDAVAGEDLERIARAAILSSIPFIAVDPGIFTAHVVREKGLGARQEKAQSKLLFALGSVNDVAAAQAMRLFKSPQVYHTYLDTALLLESERQREKEIARAACDLLLHAPDFPVCCIAVAGIQPEKRIRLEPYAERDAVSCDEISSRINRALAEVMERVLEKETAFKGLFACGGDVAVAVCSRLSAIGIRPLDDVMPLAVYGRLAGGKRPELHIVTKGGMVGGEDAMLECLSFLENKTKE